MTALTHTHPPTPSPHSRITTSPHFPPTDTRPRIRHGRATHSLSLVAQLCENPNCTKHATFGSPLDRKKKWCSSHKPPGAVDVKNPRCTVPTCTKQATHRGPSGFDSRGKVTYRRLLCGSHKHSILTVDGDFVCYGRCARRRS